MPATTPLTTDYWLLPTPSVRGPPAGDVVDRAGAERAAFAGEPGDESGDFLRAAGAAHRDAADHVGARLRRRLLQDLRLDHGGRDRVDQDRPCRQLLAERFGQPNHRRL